MSTYSKEFKEEAMRLSDEIGVKKAAAQLGIPRNPVQHVSGLEKPQQAQDKTNDDNER